MFCCCDSIVIEVAGYKLDNQATIPGNVRTFLLTSEDINSFPVWRRVRILPP
jgi:hypothetical protein